MSQPQRRPRSPGFAYAALTLILIVVIGTFALTLSNPPPPSIAEFAPQAVQQIKESQANQTFGSGLGSARQPLDSPLMDVPKGPNNEPIEVARVRKCIGDPPRQIEDPQSPPCVAYWQGDNGGATYKGVTRDEIILTTPNYLEQIQPVLARFFNKRFEFYGRSIRVVPLPSNGNGGTDQAGQRADAVAADEQVGAFGSLNYHGSWGGPYVEEMARRKLIVAQYFATMPESSMERMRPYVWQYPMGVDRELRDLGTWACHRLAGGNAVYAGTQDLRERKRVFGIIQETLSAGDAQATPLEESLGQCGEKSARTLRGFRVTNNAENATNTVLQMKTARVTSVFCFCESVATLSAAATSQAYFPEWLVSTPAQHDSAGKIKFWGAEQRSQMFGVSYLPRIVAMEQDPSRWAELEGGGTPSVTTNETMRNWFHWYYRSMLLLASGIQMAGPRLTPQTFEAGLQKALFPNPRHPNNAGTVGFRAGGPGASSSAPVYTMTRDGAEFWWSNEADGPFDDSRGGGGAVCYVNGGERHSGSDWPSGGDPFFTGECDSGA